MILALFFIGFELIGLRFREPNAAPGVRRGFMAWSRRFLFAFASPLPLTDFV